MRSDSNAEPVQIRQILVGVDGSARSRRALLAAAELASSLEAGLEGLLVEEEDWYRMTSFVSGRLIGAYSGHSRPIEEARMARELRSHARRIEASVRNIARTMELETRFRAVRGRPRHVLRDAAAGADLVIVAHLGRRSGGPRGIGSTAVALIRECGTPVLLLPDGRGRTGRILWVTDGSPSGERARRVAEQLARGRVPVERISADDPGALIDRTGAPGVPPMVVAPRGLPMFAVDRLDRTFAVLRVPLVLI